MFFFIFSQQCIVEEGYSEYFFTISFKLEILADNFSVSLFYGT
jgi:hypothetical protein